MTAAIQSMPLGWFLLILAGAMVCAVTLAVVFDRVAAHRSWNKKRRRRK